MSILLALALSLSAQAAPLKDYLVFSRTTIEGKRSDFQGTTAALGAIQLENFLIAGDLASSTSISLRSGTVKGAALAPSISLSKATARKRGKASTAGLVEANGQIDSLAQRLSSLDATAAPAWGSGLVRGEQGDVSVDGLFLTSTQAVEVIGIRAEDFAAASNLVLDGSADSLLIVRIYGSNVSFANKGVFLRGNLKPANVIFYFPEATGLELGSAGGAVDPVTGVHYGIPGTVIAPYAVVNFYSVLVTGQLFVGRLCNTTDLPTGQVNYGRSLYIDRYYADYCGCISVKF